MSKTDSAANPIKLSQWDALILESAKSIVPSGEELLHRVRTGTLPADESKFKFDYTRLTELHAEDPAAFEQALHRGYRIKYNTLRGIASWIQLALGQEAVLQAEPGNESIVAALTEEEYGRLTAVLSSGWLVRSEPALTAEGRSVYLIEPLVRS
ncbi:hypothetical protein ACFFK0_00245 [Paenibacillus chartarius]|uniref:Uncharacterized protein n=1 Tax=Paenibacillus chartarius TaxID=747481 RepID=A0ABV6DE44_9BACL